MEGENCLRRADWSTDTRFFNNIFLRKSCILASMKDKGQRTKMEEQGTGNSGTKDTNSGIKPQKGDNRQGTEDGGQIG
jgi:hypothetical protein